MEKWGDYVHRLDYKAIRTANYLYVEYSNKEHELYNLSTDAYQLESKHATADPALITHLASRLRALRECAGASCRTAEGPEYKAPTISITTPAKGAAYVRNQDVKANYRCKDEAGGSGLKLCEGPVAPGSPIDTNSVGPKSFTVTAEDNDGNRNSATTNYRVRYKFSGFFSPVNNWPTLNRMKAGRVVPVRFALNGFQGLGIFAEGYPKSVRIACDPTAPVDGVEQTVRASTSSLSYDRSTGRYSYTWKTYAAWADTCRQFVAKLKDGSYRRANFRFE